MKFSKIKKCIISCFLCAVIISSLNINASAAEITATKSQTNVESYANNQKSNIEISAEKLEKYVTRNSNGTLTLNAPQRELNKINPITLESIKTSLKDVNSSIIKGDLKSTNSLTIIDPKEKNYTIQSGGVTRWQRYWWGAKLWLSDRDTKQLIHELNIGASGGAAIGAVTGLASLPAGAAVAAGAAAVKFGATIIQENNAGRGVVITFGGHLAPTWIGGQ